MEQSKEINSRPKAQYDTVEAQAQPAEEQQGCEVCGHRGDNGHWKFDCAISASEVINPRGHQHVEQSTADLTPAVGAMAVCPGDLRNHLTAERALSQIGAHRLTAVHALSRGNGLAWQGTHCGWGIPLHKRRFEGNPPSRRIQPESKYEAPRSVARGRGASVSICMCSSLRLFFLARPGQQHGEAAAVDLVRFAVETDQVPFFELDGEQNIRGAHNRKV
jgi:hypothetical protein